MSKAVGDVVGNAEVAVLRSASRGPALRRQRRAASKSQLLLAVARYEAHRCWRIITPGAWAVVVSLLRQWQAALAVGVRALQYIADAVVYLASDEASYLHGTLLDVDGRRNAAAVIAA